ncbi:MAG: hypothetical protein ACKO18_05795 [Bacteroidota bacterium]
MEDWALLVGLGMVAGLVGGLFGVWGGVIYVPVLGWWLDRQGLLRSIGSRWYWVIPSP